MYLGNECVICGAKDNLQFDHKEAKSKYLNISSPKLLDGNIDIFWEEVNKCQLLCCSCHKTKTKENKDHPGGKIKIEFRGCGTGPSYGDGCRCNKCQEWKREYRNKIRTYAGHLILP
jgi:hypothetical protein